MYLKCTLQIEDAVLQKFSILALSRAAKDDSIKILAITGTGDYFSSGNDLSNFLRAQDVSNFSTFYGKMSTKVDFSPLSCLQNVDPVHKVRRD